MKTQIIIFTLIFSVLATSFIALQSCKKDHEDRIVGDWVHDCKRFSLFVNCTSSTIVSYHEDGTYSLYSNNDCKKGNVITGPHNYQIKEDSLIRESNPYSSIDTLIIEELTRRKLILRYRRESPSGRVSYRRCR